jgi:hypothetical protein
MRFIKELLLAAILTAVFFVVLMALLPSKSSVERELVIHHPISQVYDMVKSFKQFPAWSPWGLRDHGTTYQFSPTLAGPGAKVDWNSPADPWIGTGSLEVTEQVEGESITYDVVSPWRGKSKTLALTLEENDVGDVIGKYRLDVDYGWDLFGRVNGLYLESHIGDDLTYSLAQIKTKIEALPEVDYSEDLSENPPVLVRMEPLNVLQINGQAATNLPYSVQPTVLRFTESLTATIDIQKLTRTGPRLAVLNRWGQNYDFTAAVPVEETTAAEIPEGVSFGVLPGGNFLKVQYKGARWDLPRQRDMLTAYAGANGYRLRGTIIEEFLNDTGGEGDAAIREADLETNIYLPVD